jgi:hypothetical protein
VVLYWIYIRTRNSPGLFDEDGGEARDPPPPQRSQEAAGAISVHRELP